MCLAVSLQSSKVLSCVALWMQVYIFLVYTVMRIWYNSCKKTLHKQCTVSVLSVFQPCVVYLQLYSIMHLKLCVVWLLQVYPSEALSLSHSLYSSFCEQLPNASEPLVQVASLCPQLAYQLASSFTNLHPFHISTFVIIHYTYHLTCGSHRKLQ